MKSDEKIEINGVLKKLPLPAVRKYSKDYVLFFTKEGSEDIFSTFVGANVLPDGFDKNSINGDLANVTLSSIEINDVPNATKGRGEFSSISDLLSQKNLDRTYTVSHNYG